jgi:hypothetical protein
LRTKAQPSETEDHPLAKPPARPTPTVPTRRSEAGTLATLARLILRTPRPTTLLSSSTLASRARPRLNLLARHLSLKPTLELNTPFSVDRRAASAIEFDDDDPAAAIANAPALVREPVRAPSTVAADTAAKEEPAMTFQEAHPALLIPGPIELEDDVLKAMGHFRSVARTCAWRAC